MEVRAPATAPLREWTVLVYLDGDNELREAVTENLQELVEVGSTPDMQVAATLYRGHRQWSLKNLPFKLSRLFRGEPDPVISPDWRGRRTFVVAGPGATTEVANPGRTGAASADALKDFLVWGMQAYPAKHTLVVLSDHGDGHRGLMMDGRGEQIPMPEVRRAFAEARQAVGRGVDVLALEACSMGQAEVAYELREAADYLVASPDFIYGGAFRHDQVLRDLQARQAQGPLSPREAAAALVEASAGFSDDVPDLAAVDLAQAQGLREALDGLSRALRATDTPEHVLETLVYRAPSYGPTVPGRMRPSHEFTDVRGLVRALQGENRVQDPALKAAASEVERALERALVATRSTEDERCGLSLFLPTDGPGLLQKVERPYRDLQFAQDGEWDEYLAGA